MCWMREFIQLAGRVMLPYSSGILTAVLPCLAYDDRKKSILHPEEGKWEQPLRRLSSCRTLVWGMEAPLGSLMPPDSPWHLESKRQSGTWTLSAGAAAGTQG